MVMGEMTVNWGCWTGGEGLSTVVEAGRWSRGLFGGLGVLTGISTTFWTVWDFSLWSWACFFCSSNWRSNSVEKKTDFVWREVYSWEQWMESGNLRSCLGLYWLLPLHSFTVFKTRNQTGWFLKSLQQLHFIVWLQAGQQFRIIFRLWSYYSSTLEAPMAFCHLSPKCKPKKPAVDLAAYRCLAWIYRWK